MIELYFYIVVSYIADEMPLFLCLIKGTCLEQEFNKRYVSRTGMMIAYV